MVQETAGVEQGCGGKRDQNPDNDNLLLGRMRCLEALAEYSHLHGLACEKWPTVSDEVRSKMATMAAASAWGLGKSVHFVSGIFTL